MIVFFRFLLFFMGACIASFINVLVYRIPLQLNYVKGRSFCPKCHHQLTCIDMIPIVGWFLLRGRCRYCHCRISIRYVVIEFIGGVFILFCYDCFGFHLMFVMFLYFMFLLAISIIDYQIMIIPNELVLACLMIAIMSIPLFHLDFFSRVIGMCCLSIPLYLLNCLYPDSFGGGDIKLLSVNGFFLGWKVLLVSMYISSVIAGFYAFYLLIRYQSQKKYIAFGPFISIGFFIALLVNIY